MNGLHWNSAYLGISWMCEKNEGQRNFAKAAAYLWAFVFAGAVAFALTDLLTTGRLRLDLLIWPFVPGEWWAPYATWQFCLGLAIWVTVRAFCEAERTKR